MSISVENGHPCFQFELGGGPAKLLLEAARVDDGQPHVIEARRTGRTGELVLDNEEKVTGTSQVQHLRSCL